MEAVWASGHVADAAPGVACEMVRMSLGGHRGGPWGGRVCSSDGGAVSAEEGDGVVRGAWGGTDGVPANQAVEEWEGWGSVRHRTGVADGSQVGLGGGFRGPYARVAVWAEGPQVWVGWVAGRGCAVWSAGGCPFSGRAAVADGVAAGGGEIPPVGMSGIGVRTCSGYGTRRGREGGVGALF